MLHGRPIGPGIYALLLLAAALLTGGCAAAPAGDESQAPKFAVLDVGQVAGTPAAARPSTTAPATRPAAADLLDKATPPAAHWEAIARILGRKGVEADALVYTVTVPRDDLIVNIEGMELPTAAGIASVFHFYRCPCGKTVVVGQFCVADYEVNDVIDALRKVRIEVASVAPMLLHTRANPQLVRFQAEGNTEPIATALRDALSWTGKERMAPQAPLGTEAPAQP